MDKDNCRSRHRAFASGCKSETRRRKSCREKAAVDVAVNRKERGVIFIRVRRALLEIKWENRELFLSGIFRRLSSGKAEQLDELPAIFRSILYISQQRIQKIIFALPDCRIAVM